MICLNLQSFVSARQVNSNDLWQYQQFFPFFSFYLFLVLFFFFLSFGFVYYFFFWTLKIFTFKGD